jgi:predicted DNA-binding transcriptional regulator AlpA
VAAKTHKFDDLPRWTPRVLESHEFSTVRLLLVHDVCDRVSFSRAQIYDMMAAGCFPRPIKFSPGRRGSVRWPDIWISEWLKLAVASATHRQQVPLQGVSGCEHVVAQAETTGCPETRNEL